VSGQGFGLFLTLLVFIWMVLPDDDDDDDPPGTSYA